MPHPQTNIPFEKPLRKRAPRRTRRFRSVVARLGLVVIGGLVGLLLAEILLRLLGVAYPLPYYPDPYCGSRLRPGFQGWFTKEGRAFVTINSAGFRDREHSLTKPPEHRPYRRARGFFCRSGPGPSRKDFLVRAGR